jgi:hypothetical protein
MNHMSASEDTIEKELTERLSITTVQDKQILKEYIGAKLYDIAKQCTVRNHILRIGKC